MKGDKLSGEPGFVGIGRFGSWEPTFIDTEIKLNIYEYLINTCLPT